MPVRKADRQSRVKLRLTFIALVAGSAVGCAPLSRLSEVGNTPGLTHIEDPTTAPGYRPVSLPQPAVQQVDTGENSLWRPGARAFFKDQRAKLVGDVLTVSVNIQDQGQINNTTTRSTKANEDAATPNLYGLESPSFIGKIFPKAYDPNNLVHMSSDGSSQGTGAVSRNETIQIKMAAVVTQVMPNGNLVIQGRQEIRVNFEVRELVVNGVIRPEDIDSTNSIDSSMIAEARISYGGRGQITDVQQPRYGQQIYDFLFPF
ncbi:MAG TPA: flagellar basal body L-ring protein FlgH [Alphaproteobacteria bacterium]|nr:flagellar basal body L-ring protein FlgH [Alphaproteobacteria bacterium]